MRTIDSIVSELRAAMAAQRRAEALAQLVHDQVVAAHTHLEQTTQRVGTLQRELRLTVEAGVPA